MKLQSAKYSEYENQSKKWEVKNLEVEEINLIVGKNATGKTRTINILSNLAKLLSAEKKFDFEDGKYDVVFSDKKSRYQYVLEYHDKKIESEKLSIDGELMFSRTKEGKGKIYAKKINNGEMVKFQVPENELTIVARRGDQIQHPFLDPIYQWAKSVLHFEFGRSLGKDQLAIIDKKKELAEIRDTNKVIQVFKNGQDKFGAAFVKSIISDFKEIGYFIEDIELRVPEFIKVEGVRPVGDILAMYVKEKGLGWIHQLNMSQGMFRALSVIIQFNYAQRTDATECMLIDDIGEGLDYERSCLLINLLVEKTKNSSIQLIMTTNDRFVMNTVPLEYWSVIDRKSGTCTIFNYKNSKKIFDEFKFTGLNNFDFLATDFIHELDSK